MVTVSVVIPAYGHALFLRQTIQSILQQSWQDYEIIVVDDGSPDNSAVVAAEFGRAIRYIHQKNRGMAAARNTGIRHASGTIISFLDDDDLWLPDYLATVVPYFQNDPDLAALHTGHQLTSDLEGHDYPKAGTRTVPPHTLYNTLIENGFFPPSSVSVRRSVLDTVGVFDEKLQGYADWELWLRICREYKFVGIPDILVKYRLHAGGLSSNIKHMTDDRLKALRKHFGPPDGDISTWPEDQRRAYGFAYRTAAIEYNIQGHSDEAWRLLKQAVTIWPEILERLDTFYELACGDQSKGYRGSVALPDLDKRGGELLARINILFDEVGLQLESKRPRAYGNAHLALAILSDRAGQWSSARYHLRQAVKFYPRFLTSYPIIRRLAKLHLGKKLIDPLAAGQVSQKGLSL